MERLILNVRRAAILGILTLSFAYYKAADNSAALASIGLVSFAAISQLAPAFFGGLYWKRGTARGAMFGMAIGCLIWAYTLLLPTLVSPDHWLIVNGLFGIGILLPENLFAMDINPLGNGVLWSLTFNTMAYVAVSLMRPQDAIERVQATVFVSFDPGSRASIKIGNTRANVKELTDTVARYLGEDRARRAFNKYWKSVRLEPNPNRVVDTEILRFSEQLLASAIGASSSRLVHTLLLKRFDTSISENIRLLDEASEALKYNQDVLQTALDQLDQGITVFDKNLRLASWNRQFRLMLSLPASVGQAGTTLADIAASICRENGLEDHDPDGNELASSLLNEQQSWQMNLYGGELIIEVRTSTMPGGGLVVTWNDITERFIAAEALRDANETLERRVEERTSDLMKLNKQLEVARHEADQANASKTRFLAATGHDILQPLNAARLYTSTLSERLGDTPDAGLVNNISVSLESVEEILGAILAISRLDANRYDVKRSRFPLHSLLEQIAIEFEPAAAQKGLELKLVPTKAWTESDPALLKRMFQNLVSNAIKYTRKGKVLVGVRQHGDEWFLQVHDTGIGISEEAAQDIFSEFKRLDEGAREAPGLGLGLSIVERISKLLDHAVEVHSEKGSGTRFRIRLPRVSAEVMPAVVSAPKQRRANLALTGTRVLCIDNETSILEGMAGLLSQWGCDVRTATDLQSALSSIEQGGFEQGADVKSGLPDIILADYHLDNANGLDAVASIREQYGDIPAVLITADRSTELKEKAAKTGITVLNKPVKPAPLRSIITQTRTVRQAAE